MTDIWSTLEQRSRAWHALQRQALADAVWKDYVRFRFGRTGDPRALEYLYPYLNHAERTTRLRAIGTAGGVFEGRGPEAVDALGYFTKNPDLFIRDRAVEVIGAAVAGSPDHVILETLEPYLDARNQFVRKLALVALGKAAAGQASAPVLEAIRRVATRPGPRSDEVDTAIASVFSGRPTEEVYGLVAKPELVNRIDTGNAGAVALLVCGASDGWYARACREVFEPRLRIGDREARLPHFVRREGIGALCHAAQGRGMEPLERMLHLRGSRCTGHALAHGAPRCFIGADAEANRPALVDLARTGDVPAQRAAAMCLGRLTMGLADTEAIDVLREMCDARNKAVQAAALEGLGMAARSTCDEDVRRRCLDRATDPETGPTAIRTLGMVYFGSGRSDVFDDIRALAHRCRAEPARGRKYSKPLAACYHAVGLVYLGTGSTDPVDFFLDALAVPKTHQWDEYHWCASRALVKIEFSEPARWKPV